MAGPGRNAWFVLAALISIGAPADAAAQGCVRPCVGPTRGAVLAAGGGHLGARIYRRFVDLAGGPDARIVLIPTAGVESGSQDAWVALSQLRDAGATNIEVLHTRTRAVAELEAFSGPLREATGVWISGGYAWRLTEVYLDTRTQSALEGVLARGGVVAGNSAGASVLASYLVRGSKAGNQILMGPGADVGFGFLRNVAIDQHLLSRGRELDLLTVLQSYPTLLGLGLDEGAAVVITGDLAEVIGASPVAVYDLTDPMALLSMRWLAPGDVYDLGLRRPLMSAADGGHGPP